MHPCFAAETRLRLSPLSIASQNEFDDRVELFCTDDQQQPVYCSVCRLIAPRFGRFRLRIVRDLDCGERMVFLSFKFPRVQCNTHGVVMAYQAFFEPHSPFTILFEDFALSLVSDDVTVTEVAKRLKVSRNVLGRILHRAYRRRRVNRKKSSCDLNPR